MSSKKRLFNNYVYIFIVVVIFMVYKYHHDQQQMAAPKLSTDSFVTLEQGMLARIIAVPDAVKRRINISDQSFDYSPHRASYRAIMHLNDLYSGNAIVSSSRDCDNWYEEYAVQLKPANEDNALFDYRAQRVESIAAHRAEVQTNVSSWYQGQQEATEEVLRFQRIGGNLEVSSEGETNILSSETKLNIESSRYILRQMADDNFVLEFISEPDEFSSKPVQKKVRIERFTHETLLDQLWIIKTEQYKDTEGSYQLSSTTIELLNDRAVTLYAATLGDDGLLYELVLNDFEYLATRCMKTASLNLL